MLCSMAPDFFKAFVGMKEYYSDDDSYLTIGFGTIGKIRYGHLERIIINENKVNEVYDNINDNKMQKQV